MICDVSWESLVIAAARNGLTLQPVSNIHQRLNGGVVIVNVYRRKDGWSVYVNGMAKGRKVRSVEEIIKAAKTIPDAGYPVAERNRKGMRRVRSSLWRAKSAGGCKPRCHWCGQEIAAYSDSSIDHVIPISKGGSNGGDNLVLTHATCNHRRGNRVTAEDLASIRKGVK